MSEIPSPWPFAVTAPCTHTGGCAAAMLSLKDVHEQWSRVHSRNSNPLLTGWRLCADHAGAPAPQMSHCPKLCLCPKRCYCLPLARRHPFGIRYYTWAGCT